MPDFNSCRMSQLPGGPGELAGGWGLAGHCRETLDSLLPVSQGDFGIGN